ncbi:NAD(P)-dependent alcohol dehydrogenase [Pseudonocardia kujensis]|uniref:zinc-dependent alcohol dehydrogenase family protein n=1 Tax=Pseudonocardia kujensis TaxID=1128675 RepID=UPI001E2AA017|nr:NAD(P)-dependent alcohol dehydrogenase [Pseudonocardia kujensis]MCE0764107.1 NAD(P)-dependent alcohol dehydrogenase [Pseudonocardia kujensis]
MKAYRFDRFGGFDHLNVHDAPVPAARPGEVVVRVRAVSLNFRDVAIPTGRHPAHHDPGMVPTSDAAGEIVEVGEGAPFAVGDRVISAFHPRWFGGRPPATLALDQYGRGRDGWLTEYKAVGAEAVVPLPDSVSYVDGATLPCAALTAWTCLGGPEPVRAGQTVLTLGSGGVSLFAVQLAKASGAQVVATTSSPAKAERLKHLGADHVIDYRATPAWGRVAREITAGAGVDRVVEVGGPGTLSQSMIAIAAGSEIALVGFLDGSATTIDFGELFRSSAHLRQVRVGDRAGLAEVVAAVARGGISPVIDSVFGFAEAPAAFRHLDGGDLFGKVVISLD